MKLAMRWTPGSAFVVALAVAVSAHAVGPKYGRGSSATPPAPPDAPTPMPAVAPVPRVAPLPPLPPTPPTARLAPLARLRHMLPPKGWYGVSLRCSDCSIRRDDDDGAVLEWRFRSDPEIAGVEPESPAAVAGVQEGDVITHINGAKITSREGGKSFGATAPGETVKWTLERAGKPVDVTLKVGDRPEEWGALAGELDALRLAEKELERANERLTIRLRDADASPKAEREALLDAQRQLENARRQLRQAAPRAYMWGYDTTPAPDGDERTAERARRAEEQARRLRYQGDVGSSHVEVRGSSRVVVTEDDDGNVVIDTPDATIKVQKKR